MWAPRLVPGATKTFTLTLRAPVSLGTYHHGLANGAGRGQPGGGLGRRWPRTILVSTNGDT